MNGWGTGWGWGVLMVWGIAAGAGVARAGDVESFNSRLFDVQYFSRPSERVGPEGGAADVLRNPALLGERSNAEACVYSSFHRIDGATYGLEKLIPPGPGNPEPIRCYETPVAKLASFGAVQSVGLGGVPGNLAVQADGFWNDLDDNQSSHIEQEGVRVGVSYGVAVSSNLAVGYEVVGMDDTFQWGVTWPHFLPGEALPRNVDYILRSEAASWRHRLGLAGKAGEAFRYETTAEWGCGDMDNQWNGEKTGGADGMEHLGWGGRMEYDVCPWAGVFVSMSWQSTRIEFGRHHPEIGHGGGARWDAEAYRPLAGFRFAPAKGWDIHGAYQHSIFEVGELCGHEADHDYGTWMAGTAVDWQERIRIRADAQYSCLESGGEWAGLLAVEAGF